MTERMFANRTSPLKRAIVDELTRPEITGLYEFSVSRLLSNVREATGSNIPDSTIRTHIGNLRREGFITVMHDVPAGDVQSADAAGIIDAVAQRLESNTPLATSESQRESLREVQRKWGAVNTTTSSLEQPGRSHTRAFGRASR